ncbi:MAG: glycosyltransferase family 4 protein, partial [Deltaproteobacteria bacterium]|nr:glycosyltransferase family 4 protein [Deltaproteobacteria bacterium]
MPRSLSRRDDLDAVFLPVPFEPATFGRLPLLGQNWTVRGSYRARRAVLDALSRGPLDALFIHTQTVGVLSLDLVARIPTLLSLDATPRNYDEFATWYGDRVHTAPLEAGKRAVHPALVRRARWITTWSDWARRSVIADYGANPDRVTVLHPGTTLADSPDPRLRGPRRPGKLRLLFVGGDFRRKGGDLLVEVFRSELADVAELHLVTSAELPSTPGVTVRRGLRPHSAELLALYADADVFVLPTRADCLAVVLGEAMAAGLPIVTTRVGAHPEAVEEDRSGHVLDVDDARGLAARRRELALDPARARAMGLRGREIGEERFDMDRNAAASGDLLLRLARE